MTFQALVRPQRSANACVHGAHACPARPHGPESHPRRARAARVTAADSCRVVGPTGRAESGREPYRRYRGRAESYRGRAESYRL